VTQIFDEMVKRIHHGNNPYSGFPVGLWEGNDYGFMGDTTFFEQAMERYQPRIVIEVGSFLGMSARWFAQWQKDHNIDGAVICIDTWLAEGVLWSIAEHYNRLTFQYGRPHAYEVFMQGVINHGLQDYICPLPMDSRSGLRYLMRLNITAPLVFIDGSHIEGDVMADLNLGWDRLQMNGCLIVDDYSPELDHAFDGLMHDVDRFSLTHGLGLEVFARKARMYKSG
jgi:hypothetical protein